jgi:L-ascorbate metabolism protein UlaG (beta-lactamase superfamily)
MSIKLRWLGWACFEIILPSGKVLITDPFIDYSPSSPIKTDQLIGADYISLTHTHFDHCTDVGSLVKKYHSKVICPVSMAGRLIEFFGLDWANVIRVRAGDRIIFDDLQVEVKRAEHIHLHYTREEELRAYYPPPLNEMMPAMIAADLHQMPVRDMEMVNYVFQTGDNLRTLMYGGITAEYLRHEVVQTHPNIALFQALDPALVADFAALCGAEVVIPYHHDMRMEDTHRLAGELAGLLEARTRAKCLDIEPGKWYEVAMGVSGGS